LTEHSPFCKPRASTAVDLRGWMAANGLNAKKLANKLGVTPYTIYRWCNGTAQARGSAADELYLLIGGPWTGSRVRIPSDINEDERARRTARLVGARQTRLEKLRA